ncbi:MAG: hypothetical protein CMB98_05510 [Flavobacteriaceae bacterium]|nr:hypothetical protein [Flavobacteriaceae bacterium]|tara:strand:+ start:39 stop:530 length:492 start_codon:yes stop_codon:yes gene_type:complete
MLTKELLKDHFYTAYFIDNNRENIEVLYTNEEKDKMFTCIIPFNKEHGQYKILNEFISLDQLHENTYQKKQDERAHFEKTVMGIAKKEGMVFDEHKLDSKFFPLLVKAIFEDNNEDHLFATKIALLELDKIKNAPNNDTKKKLRQSKNMISTLQAAFDLVKNN